MEVGIVDRQICMRRKRPSLVRRILKKYHLPEGIKFLKMFRPFIFYAFIKNWPEQLILSYGSIKCIDQQFNIFFCCNILHLILNIEYSNASFTSKQNYDLINCNATL